MLETSYERRLTRPVRVGNIIIGGNNPIVIQSMITEETANTEGAVGQIIQLHKAGAEIVRVTTPTLRDAQNLKNIKAELRKRYMDVPLVADVHHQGTDIAIEAATHVEKVRINPGLLAFHKRIGRTEEYTQTEIDYQLEEIDHALRPILARCKDRGVAMRYGTNHGSLSERLMVMYGDTPKGMVESVMEYLKVSERNDFYDIVLSLKASDVRLMVAANQLMVERMDQEGMNYPIHSGVTEAGNGSYARTKSILGIGSLLTAGIGDTIRVSLAEDPVNEIEVCNEILQGLGLKRTKMELVACPGCGRTKFDLPTMTNAVNAVFSHLKEEKIAVMGCIVNGLGEMADATHAFVGLGGERLDLYKHRQRVKNVPQHEAIEAMIDILKEDGRWIEPDFDIRPILEEYKLNKRVQFDLPNAPGEKPHPSAGVYE